MKAAMFPNALRLIMFHSSHLRLMFQCSHPETPRQDYIPHFHGLFLITLRLHPNTKTKTLILHSTLPCPSIFFSSFSFSSSNYVTIQYCLVIQNPNSLPVATALGLHDASMCFAMYYELGKADVHCATSAIQWQRINQNNNTFISRVNICVE